MAIIQRHDNILAPVIDRRHMGPMTTEEARRLADLFGCTVFYRDERCLQIQQGYAAAKPGDEAPPR